MALIDDVKIYLRISTTAYNTEITDLISAAKADLALAGVLTISEADSLYKRAICLYCKANFGYDNKDADRQYQAYDNIKKNLMIAINHAYYAVTFNCGELTYVEFNGIKKNTNESGSVTLYSRAGNQLPYSIGGGAPNYIDVAGDTTVTIS